MTTGIPGSKVLFMRLIRGNVIAIVALVFAMTGTGIAASRYLITSSSQIKPSVRRELEASAVAAANAKKGAKAIVARLSSTGPVSVPDIGEVPVPLAGSSWTQHPEELQEVVMHATITSPPQESCTSTGDVSISAAVDGLSAGGLNTALANEGATESLTETLRFTSGQVGPFSGGASTAWLFEPGQTTTRTLALKASANCAGKGGLFKIDSVAVDVVGVR